MTSDNMQQGLWGRSCSCSTPAVDCSLQQAGQIPSVFTWERSSKATMPRQQMQPRRLHEPHLQPAPSLFLERTAAARPGSNKGEKPWLYLGESCLQPLPPLHRLRHLPPGPPCRRFCSSPRCSLHDNGVHRNQKHSVCGLPSGMYVRVCFRSIAKPFERERYSAETRTLQRLHFAVPHVVLDIAGRRWGCDAQRWDCG